MPKKILKKNISRISNRYYGKYIKNANYITNIKRYKKKTETDDNDKMNENYITKIEYDNKNTNTDIIKNIKDYKIFVFDLDYTLYLHTSTKYADCYHLKIRNWLEYLKDNNKHLYIATHHSSPTSIIEELKIEKLINCVLKETKDIDKSYSISDYTSKKGMIEEILNKTENKNYTTDDVVFFDDNPYNIHEVNKINVKSILVDGLKGINLSELY